MMGKPVDRLCYTIVVGNGFDLDLKFKTRYSDFVDSDEWKMMYEQRSRTHKQYSLLQYLNGKRYTDEWFDIESALLDYVSIRKDGSFVNNVEQDKDDYHYVCKALNDYLDNHINNSHHFLNETCAGQLLRSISMNSDWEKKRFYSFNFTPIESYSRILGNIHEPNPQYLHGQIMKKSVILGIEVDDIHDIAPGYSFLIKSNHSSYKSSEIVHDLMKSNNVIIFGHSLNRIDLGYFEDYFKLMENNEDIHRRITIITFDEESKLQLLDNLRKCGISVQKLYTHSHVEVIRTKYVNEKQNNSDTLAFNHLLERLSKL